MLIGVIEIAGNFGELDILTIWFKVRATSSKRSSISFPIGIGFGSVELAEMLI